MAKITFIKEKKTIEVEPGTNLRKAALKEGIDLYPGLFRYINCMGLGSCGSCLVHVKKGMENTTRQGLKEYLRLILDPFTMMRRIGHEDEVRLACQTRVNGDIEVETKPEVNLHGEKFWG